MSLRTLQPGAGDYRRREDIGDISPERLQEMYSTQSEFDAQISVPNDARELLGHMSETSIQEHLGRSALRSERFIPGNYFG